MDRNRKASRRNIWRKQGTCKLFMKKAKKCPSLLVLTEFCGRRESNFWYSPNSALEQNQSKLCAAVEDLLTKGFMGAAVETEGSTMAKTSIVNACITNLYYSSRRYVATQKRIVYTVGNRGHNCKFGETTTS